jgi:hypothetical protein
MSLPNFCKTSLYLHIKQAGTVNNVLASTRLQEQQLRREWKAQRYTASNGTFSPLTRHNPASSHLLGKKNMQHWRQRFCSQHRAQP